MEYHGAAGSALESSGSVIVVAWDGVSEVDEEDYNFSGVVQYLKKSTRGGGGGGGIVCLRPRKKFVVSSNGPKNIG